MKTYWKYLFAAAVVIASAAILARAYTYRYRTAGTISVTGLGETEFASDLIVLRGSIDVENYDAAEAYRSIERDKRRVEEFLTSRGIAAESISFAMLSIEKNYQSIYNDKGSYQGQRFSGYAIRQHFTVESADIDTVEKVAMEISSLIADGISIDVYDPSYYYTKLDDLKLDLIGKAAADARSRAEELARECRRQDRRSGALAHGRIPDHGRQQRRGVLGRRIVQRIVSQQEGTHHGARRVQNKVNRTTWTTEKSAFASRRVPPDLFISAACARHYTTTSSHAVTAAR